MWRKKMKGQMVQRGRTNERRTDGRTEPWESEGEGSHEAASIQKQRVQTIEHNQIPFSWSSSGTVVRAKMVLLFTRNSPIAQKSLYRSPTKAFDHDERRRTRRAYARSNYRFDCLVWSSVSSLIRARFASTYSKNHKNPRYMNIGRIESTINDDRSVPGFSALRCFTSRFRISFRVNRKFLTKTWQISCVGKMRADTVVDREHVSPYPFSRWSDRGANDAANRRVSRRIATVKSFTGVQ